MSGSIHTQGIRYLLIGVLNTLVGYGVFIGGLRLGWPHQVALAVSFLLGSTHSYLWNRFWTFRATGTHLALGGRFLIMSLGLYGLNAVLLEALVRLGMAPLWAQIACQFVTTATGFVGHRQWSFRTAQAE
jgi:putative flippase GtrA